MRAANYKKALELTEHTPWAQQFWDDLVPLKNKVVNHPVFAEMASGQLEPAAFPLCVIEFLSAGRKLPKYMGLNLAKTLPGRFPGHEQAKNWLIGNIKIEQRHAYWYQDWAMGFGLALEDLEFVEPPAAMDAVNHFLWTMG